MVTYDSQSSEAEKAFKQLLISKVRAAQTHYEAEGNLHPAGRFAIVLDDYVSQKRILSRIMSQNKIECWEYEAAGLLVLALGDIGLAERIILELENINEVSLEWLINKEIANIAIRMPNKASARRAMRLFEDKGDHGQVLNIAAAIGDKQTCEILMWKMVKEGRPLYHVNTEQLATAALYDPAAGKRLVKELLTLGRAPIEREEWYVSCAGMISAALGDKTSAKKAFDYLKEIKDSWCQCKAGQIAMALADITEAKECVLGVYAAIRRGDMWDKGTFNDIGDIIGNVAKQNMEEAVRIWKYFEEDSLLKIAMHLAAVRVLEIIGINS